MSDACKTGEETGKETRFQKGDPRINRAGRPPADKCIPDVLRWLGAHIVTTERIEKAKQIFGITEPINAIQATWLSVTMEAIQGDMIAAKLIAERSEGKPLQTIDVDDKRATPLVMVMGKDDIAAAKAQPNANAANA